jgi:serine/threonine protein kinase
MGDLVSRPPENSYASAQFNNEGCKTTANCYSDGGMIVSPFIPSVDNRQATNFAYLAGRQDKKNRMSQQEWFVQRGEQVQGPISFNELCQLAISGKLISSDPVRTSENSDWCRADTIDGLFSTVDSSGSSSDSSSAFSSGYDIEDMLDRLMELYEDNPENVPSPQSLWPDCPADILEDVQARLSPNLEWHWFLSPSDNRDDDQMSAPQLSVLKEGYRPNSSAFELTERLGKGGFGEVWKAKNHLMGHVAAFKFCLNFDPACTSLRNELLKTSRLDHPGIVRLRGESFSAFIPCLEYEFVDGKDFRKVLVGDDPENRAFTPLEPDHAAFVILKIVDIMAYVHSRPEPMVHRDLKPSNILVTNHRDLDVLAALTTIDLRLVTFKLMDFGLASHARAADRSQTIGANFDGGGTRAYMSPQQHMGLPADPSDDVFAIGVMWYELLTGRLEAGCPSGMSWHSKLILRGLDESRLKVLTDCLEAEKEDRIPNAVELVKRIRAVYSLEEPQGLFEQLEFALSDEDRDLEGLSRLTELSPETAQALAKWTGEELHLRGLTSLSSETAEALAKCSCSSLRLDGLKSLSPETAQALAKWSGEKLYLDGLTSLSPETAQALAEWSGEIRYLDGLTSLSPETAQALAEWSGEIRYLDEWTWLSPETGKALSKWRGRTLTFNGLTSLSPESAQALAKWNGSDLWLLGLESLAAETAQALAKWTGKQLLLDGLKSLSPETAQALAEWSVEYLCLDVQWLQGGWQTVHLAERSGEYLSLDGLTSLSPEAAQALAKWSGQGIYLDGLTSLSPETAQALAEWSGRTLTFNGLTSLSPETAQALAERSGNELYLNGLISLSPETAQALAKWSGLWRCLYLNGLTSLSPETAQALAKWTGMHLWLDGLTSLPPETAQALAKLTGISLWLDGLTSLSSETAEALAKCSCSSLWLDGLTSLPPETAEALAKWTGMDLYLDGLTSLSPETAQALAEWSGRDLTFNGLTSLSPETAQALFDFGGDISFSGQAYETWKAFLENHEGN